MMVLAQAAGGSVDVAEVVLFCVFAVIALGAGIAMVTMRNIVHAALMLVVNFLSIAALYLGLQSSFLSIVQVIVYAGAIMVLFLFVIMLLGMDTDDLLVEVRRRSQVFAVLGALLVAAVLLFGIMGTYTGSESRCGAQAPGQVASTSSSQACVGLDDALEDNDAGAVGVVADRLFGRYTFPFELAAVLLTVATIGAMLLGRRDETPQDEDLAWVPSAELPDELALADTDDVAITAGERRELPPLVEDDPEVAEAQSSRQRTATEVVDDPDADRDAGEDA